MIKKPLFVLIALCTLTLTVCLFAACSLASFAEAPRTDINGDGVFNIIDVSSLLNHLAFPEEDSLSFDVSSDGKVDIQDVTVILNLLTIQTAQRFSEGLEYALFTDGSGEESYAVVGIGTCQDETVCIPPTYNGRAVTRISDLTGAKAFLKKVVIPEGVTVIAENAFRSCKVLEEVVFPGTLSELQSAAFYECAALAGADLPAGVVSIGGNCFQRCGSLKSLTLPEGLKTIRTTAFSECAQLTEVSMPDSLTVFDSYCFSNCKSLASVRFSSALTEIPKGAFKNCEALTELTVPEGITEIRDEAFYKCTGLTSVSLPASLTNLGTKVFGACRAIESFSVSGGNPIYHAGAGCVIETASKTLVCGCKTTVIPDDGSVTAIGANAFFAAWDLKEISVPEGVTVLENSAFNSAGLTRISLPSTLKTVRNSALAGTKLEELILPQGLQTVEPWAFYDNKQLKTVVIPNSAETIGGSILNGCSSLREVSCPFVFKTFGSLFGSSSYSKSVKVVQRIGSTYYYYYLPQSLRIVHATGGVLESYALMNCSMLTEITLEGVERIKYDAFNHCTSLTRLDIPDSVTDFGSSIIGCTALRELHIGKNVQNLGVKAKNCPALEIITVDRENPNYFSAGNCIVEKQTGKLICASAASVIPTDGSVKIIGNCCFERCAGLTALILPASVTMLEDHAIFDCDELTTIYFMGSRAQWEQIELASEGNYNQLQNVEIIYDYTG